MQYRMFQIPVSGGSELAEELNGFLRSHRVLRVDRQLVVETSGAYWAFCVEYLEGPSVAPKLFGKVDYKELLGPEQFKRFARLRALRKELADREAVPAYAIFTNEQLAEMAKLEQPSKSGLEAIPGIGKAKMEKYGDSFLAVLQETTQHGPNP